MSPSDNQVSTAIRPIGFVDKTKEIDKYLYTQFSPDRRMRGIRISEGGFTLDVVPDLPTPPSDNKSTPQDIVGLYFPRTAYHLIRKNTLTRINTYSEDGSYIALFGYIVRSKLFYVLLSKWHSKEYLIARLRQAKYNTDLSQVEMSFDIHERRWW